MQVANTVRVVGNIYLQGKTRLSSSQENVQPTAGTGIASPVDSPSAATDSAAAQAASAFWIAHDSTAYHQAGDAIASMTRELAAASQEIKSVLPALSDKEWDFSLKDGKLVAKGDGLSKADQKVVEDVVNRNTLLVDATKSFVGAAVLNLQATPDYQGGTTNNLYGGLRPISFNDVAKQLNGTVDFKQLLSKNESLATAGGKTTATDGTRGFFALSIIGSQLHSNNSSVGFTVFPPAGSV